MYGFVSYLLSSAALAAYLVWLLLPQEYLEATGLAEIFPQKYWAVAVPIYLGVSCAVHMYITKNSGTDIIVGIIHSKVNHSPIRVSQS